MSILEIILYSVIGLAALLYLAKGIYTLIDRKKNPQKYKKKDEQEKKELDE